MTSITLRPHELEADRLMALVERMQQAGHTESQISSAIGEALRAPRRSLAQRVRALGARLGRWRSAR